MRTKNLRKFRQYYEREAKVFSHHQKKMYCEDSWEGYYHRKRLCEIFDLMDEIDFQSILDLGCAEGYYFKLLEGKSREKNALLDKVGLDISSGYLRKAKRECEDSQWVLGDAHSLPLKRGSIDLVLLSEVLEHLPKPKKAFYDAILASRRYVLISVPGQNPFKYLAKKLGWIGVEDPFVRLGKGHINEFRISELESLALEMDFKTIRRRITSYFPTSFLKRYRIPRILTLVVKCIDGIIETIPIIRELGGIQIALFERGFVKVGNASGEEMKSEDISSSSKFSSMREKRGEGKH